jgi:hypothetical protein
MCKIHIFNITIKLNFELEQMKKFLNCYLANVIVYIGVFFVFIGIADRLIQIVFAQCTNTTVSIGYCKEVVAICDGPNAGCLSRTGAERILGDFYCDKPNVGSTCKDSMGFAPCYDLYGCFLASLPSPPHPPNSSVCRINPNKFIQRYTSVKLMQTSCSPCPTK